ncbi:MAG: DNA-binding protein [Clostridia bacterium]|nr:DNA-binding protein [Clostridia bacterium]
MDKNVNISLLVDFYGEMLSEKQKEAVDLYYNEDLSLSEIADITGLTRPGVRDRLVKSEAILKNLEEKLGLLRRFEEMKEEISSIAKQLEEGTANPEDIIERLKKLS